IHSVVRDLPELRVPLADDLRRWIDVPERDGRLVLEVDVGQLGAERSVHAAIVQGEQFLDRLVVQGCALRGRRRAAWRQIFSRQQRLEGQGCHRAEGQGIGRDGSVYRRETAVVRRVVIWLRHNRCWLCRGEQALGGCRGCEGCVQCWQ